MARFAQYSLRRSARKLLKYSSSSILVCEVTYFTLNFMLIWPLQPDLARGSGTLGQTPQRVTAEMGW